MWASARPVPTASSCGASASRGRWACPPSCCPAPGPSLAPARGRDAGSNLCPTAWSWTRRISSAACGYGFTLLSSKTKDVTKVWGMGLNKDSQLGFHRSRKDTNSLIGRRNDFGNEVIQLYL
ncbi:RCC1-like G exchanging factor-like protein isoform X2 [Prionailurus iriomotensis]